MTHLMIDIETAGTRPGSAILSIGAVVFDVSGITQEWEVGVSLASCLGVGLTTDNNTLHWWGEQSKEAYDAAFSGTTDICDALIALFEFAQDEGVTHFWSHGATFDLVLLNEAAKIVGVEPVISDYRQARDTRTLYELTGVKPKTFMGTGTAHKAIDDARAQALAVIESWRIIERWKQQPVAMKIWPGLNREPIRETSGD